MSADKQSAKLVKPGKAPSTIHRQQAVAEDEVDLGAVNAELVSLQQKIEAATNKHNKLLKELSLPLLA